MSNWKTVLYDFEKDQVQDGISCTAGSRIQVIENCGEWLWVSNGKEEGFVPTSFIDMDEPQTVPVETGRTRDETVIRSSSFDKEYSSKSKFTRGFELDRLLKRKEKFGSTEVSSHIDEDSLRRGEFDSYKSDNQGSPQSTLVIQQTEEKKKYGFKRDPQLDAFLKRKQRMMDNQEEPVSDTTLPKEKKTYEFKRDPELDAVLRRKNKIATQEVELGNENEIRNAAVNQVIIPTKRTNEDIMKEIEKSKTTYYYESNDIPTLPKSIPIRPSMVEPPLSLKPTVIPCLHATDSNKVVSPKGSPKGSPRKSPEGVSSFKNMNNITRSGLPSLSTKPSQDVESVKSSKLDQVGLSVHSNQPSQSIQPSQPSQPSVQPTQPSQLSQPSQPSQPSQSSVQPSQPSLSSPSSQPSQPSVQPTPSPSSQPSQYTQPTPTSQPTPSIRLSDLNEIIDEVNMDEFFEDVDMDEAAETVSTPSIQSQPAELEVLPSLQQPPEHQSDITALSYNTVNPAPTYKSYLVVYDYQSTKEQDITVYEGEVVYVVEEIGEWCLIQTGVGEQGYVPFNYLKELTPSKQVCVLYDYESNEENQLSVTAGENLTVLQETEEWIEGQTEDGRIGWIPTSFVTFL